MDVDSAQPQSQSPTTIADPRLRFEAHRAAVWALVVVLVGLAIYLSQALLVIFGGMVFAAIIDGGARLLGRIMPVGRGIRIGIVLLLGLAFVAWVVIFAGTQIADQAAKFPALIEEQVLRAIAWLNQQGFAINSESISGLVQQSAGGVGQLTRAVGGIIGGFTTLFLILIIGIYIALEPRLYERGVAWMLPDSSRDSFLELADKMAFALRRLMFGRLVGMVFEGVITWAALALYGVPMAALLGLLTGLLAFIPNLGALVAGLLMVLVGFSGGTDMALYCVGVYLVVQTFDGYIVVPLIAKKTVDLAPALVLGMQLIFGILFGIIGLALADPLVAMIKVMLEHRSETAEHELEGESPQTAGGGPAGRQTPDPSPVPEPAT
ncbi:AI-2E family transporter [Croceicoccus ponticola]|uniref:AI-2E family transporter n=1 Tax=Croceicoccus ponticola TaxID=2217664 RepID=A0A437H1Q1_9SPHN|nr:AI-2E family transporter [Croceicoccus ponticola]RVQ69574.1 AI-2E family transporter [Croceicoccus ponticola]